MTTEQKSRIVALRRAGLGYAAVARETGLSKSTVSSFCQKNGLSGAQEEPERKDLINPPVRGNTVNAGKPYNVEVSYAKEPNPDALNEAFRILMNVR